MNKRTNLLRHLAATVTALCALSAAEAPIHAGATVTTTNFASGGALSASTMNTNFNNVTGPLNKLNPNDWSTNNTDVGYTGGKFGIGIASPAALLHLYTTTGGTRMLMYNGDPTSGNRVWRIGNYTANGAFSFDTTADDGSTGAANVLTMTRAGNVGIGTAAPGNPLSFATTLGTKINLYDNGSATNQYGLGVQSAKLQVFAPGLTDRIALGYGSSSSFTDVLTVTNGNVGIGNVSPQTKLHVGAGAMLNSTNTDNFILTTYNSSPNPNFTIGMGNGSGGIANTWLFGNSSGYVGVGTQSPITNLHVSGSIAKATVSYSRTGFFGTNDGTNPLGLSIFVRGDGTGTVRYVDLQSEEQGASTYRSLILNGNGGNVGIGQPSPTEKLHVAGNILASGTITPSDERLKHDIRPISLHDQGRQSVAMKDSAWGAFLSLVPSTYYWRKNEFKEMNFDDTRQYGFIAQNVEKLYPELVKNTGNGFKSLNYSGLIAINTAAIQQLKREKDAEIARLLSVIEATEKRALMAESRVKALENQLQAQNNRIGQIERKQEQRLASLEQRIALKIAVK